MRQYASEQPFTAMLAAGLIGFALGYFARQRLALEPSLIEAVTSS